MRGKDKRQTFWNKIRGIFLSFRGFFRCVHFNTVVIKLHCIDDILCQATEEVAGLHLSWSYALERNLDNKIASDIISQKEIIQFALTLILTQWRCKV